MNSKRVLKWIGCVVAAILLIYITLMVIVILLLLKLQYEIEHSVNP